MNNIQKRFLLFIFGCIPVRLFLVFLAKRLNIKYLPYLGYIALLPAIGFFYIFLTNSRKSGREVFGSRIWWNMLRPVHGLLYLLFAYKAIKKQKDAYLPLLLDVIIGLFSFLFYHYMSGNFALI